MRREDCSCASKIWGISEHRGTKSSSRRAGEKNRSRAPGGRSWYVTTCLESTKESARTGTSASGKRTLGRGVEAAREGASYERES